MEVIKTYSDTDWYRDHEALCSQCSTCIHNIRDGTCKAFSKGIPCDIFRNEFIHDKPYEGDNGLSYKKKPYSDVRWWANPGGIGAQCNDCIHNHRDLTCEAFPKGIPREILANDFIHDKPYEGDNGFRYKKK